MREFAQEEGEDKKRRGREEREGKGRTSDGIVAIMRQDKLLTKALSKRLLADYGSVRSVVTKRYSTMILERLLSQVCVKKEG